MVKVAGVASSLLLIGCVSVAAQSDPCVTLPSYLVNVARLQYSLNQANSSEWLNQARNFEQNSGGSSGSGGLSGFGFSAGGQGGTFNANERESLLLQSGALSSSTKEELRQEILSVSKAMEDLVQNCTGRRNVTVVYVEQNPDYAKKFALHITFNPEVDLQRNEATVVFDQPVRCVWSTTGSNALGTRRQRHNVPLMRPNGALGECVRQEVGALSIVTTSPLPILKPTIILPRLSESALRRRWGTTIKAHGTPAENGSGWLDGRYTAYIKDEPNGAVTSDPVTTASHLGYVVNVPQKGFI
jgi:hypothetical protein